MGLLYLDWGNIGPEASKPVMEGKCLYVQDFCYIE